MSLSAQTGDDRCQGGGPACDLDGTEFGEVHLRRQSVDGGVGGSRPGDHDTSTGFCDRIGCASG